ncbi:MAG: hypothetical protein DSY86_00320, partial [Marinomonas sp.]
MPGRDFLVKLRKNQKIINSTFAVYTVVLNFWVTLVAPFIIGYYVTLYYTAITTDDPTKGVSSFLSDNLVHLVVVVGLHIGVSIWTFNQSRMSHTLLEVEAIQDKLNRAESDKGRIIERMTFIDYSVTVMDIFTDLLKNNPHITKAEIYRSLLSYLSQFRKELFNFEGGALYNFAIYELNPAKRKLELVERVHDDRLSTQGRSWGIGVGHVGMSFAQKRSMICNDASKSSELNMSSADLSSYSSFISTPIGRPLSGDHLNEEPDPYGVLVVTSSN